MLTSFVSFFEFWELFYDNLVFSIKVFICLLTLILSSLFIYLLSIKKRKILANEVLICFYLSIGILSSIVSLIKHFILFFNIVKYELAICSVDRFSVPFMTTLSLIFTLVVSFNRYVAVKKKHFYARLFNPVTLKRFLLILASLSLFVNSPFILACSKNTVFNFLGDKDIFYMFVLHLFLFIGSILSIAVAYSGTSKFFTHSFLAPFRDWKVLHQKVVSSGRESAPDSHRGQKTSHGIRIRESGNSWTTSPRRMSSQEPNQAIDPVITNLPLSIPKIVIEDCSFSDRHVIGKDRNQTDVGGSFDDSHQSDVRISSHNCSNISSAQIAVDVEEQRETFTSVEVYANTECSSYLFSASIQRSESIPIMDPSKSKPLSMDVNSSTVASSKITTPESPNSTTDSAVYQLHRLNNLVGLINIRNDQGFDSDEIQLSIPDLQSRSLTCISSPEVLQRVPKLSHGNWPGDMEQYAQGAYSSSDSTLVGNPETHLNKRGSWLNPLEIIARVRFASMLFQSSQCETAPGDMRRGSLSNEGQLDEDADAGESGTSSMSSVQSRVKRKRDVKRKRQKNEKHKVTFSLFCVCLLSLAVITTQIVAQFVSVLESAVLRNLTKYLTDASEVLFILHFSVCCLFYVYCNSYLHKRLKSICRRIK